MARDGSSSYGCKTVGRVQAKAKTAILTLFDGRRRRGPRVRRRRDPPRECDFPEAGLTR